MKQFEQQFVWEQEVARSNRVAPTFLQIKPFDQKVERLFSFVGQRVAHSECAVKRLLLEASAMHQVICRNARRTGF
jgi:hypothetical protein